MNKILYLDIISGISGDMMVGALLDLLSEKDIEEFKKQLLKLNIEDEYEIQITRKSKQGIFGTKFDVIFKNVPINNDDNHGRNLYDIDKIIEESTLSVGVKSLSKGMFMRIANAESKIHAKPISQVHFHEVGAVDSIVDIVSVAILLEMLNIDDIRADKVYIGSGVVKCEHGFMPVPAPATLEILKGVPTYSTGIQSELVTPTGAAIIKTVVKEFGARPNMSVEKIGYGIGTKDLEIANVLRVCIAITEEEKNEEELVLLETNIDDMSSEIFSHLYEKIFSLGALDVFTIPISMKKSRPAVLLNVLANKDCAEKVSETIFKETSTFGIRKSIVLRQSLDRQMRKVITQYGEVAIKIGYYNGEVIKVVPEYEHIKNIATIKDKPFIDVYNDTIVAIKDKSKWI